MSAPLVVAAVEPVVSTPPGGPPLTSPTSVVTAARPTDNNLQGARHRRLQLFDLQLRHLPGAHRQRFLVLMVGVFGPPASTPPEGPPSTAEYKVQDNRAGRRKIGPTCGFAASPEVSPGASVDTLNTGYPRIQALSQDKEHDVHLHATT
jgi:hypothetical protein